MGLLKTLTVVVAVVGCSSNENEGGKPTGSKEWRGYGHDVANSRANVR